MNVDLYSGPGGWCVAGRMLGLPPFAGFELDPAACATRAAAGHVTVRANVARYPFGHLAGKVQGAAGSPPCVTFSAAGKRGAASIMDILEDAICDAFQGWHTRAAHRKDMARTLRMAWWPSPKLTRAQRAAKIQSAVRSAALVIEPARLIHATRPEWVALEQVPAVLPLWQAYAAELRKLGYAAWCGVLNAADYGVPQVRHRAILIASRTRAVGRPAATHYDPRKGMQLFGAPWVTMAEALGWGMSDRPYFTLATAGGTRGGADEQVGGSGARRSLYAERDAGRWTVRTSFGAPSDAPHNGSHQMDPATRPAHAVTTKAKDWVLHTNRDQHPDGTRQTADPYSAPAPALTAKSGGQWVVKRPATTVRCDQPEETIRLTVDEAAALQSFPRGYPWRGSVTRQFQQCGNAIPPLLAMHVLAEASGAALPVAGEREEAS